jgi:hypothetical protein
VFGPPPSACRGPGTRDYPDFTDRRVGWETGGGDQEVEEETMGKTGNKRRARKKKKANHGKRPNS